MTIALKDNIRRIRKANHMLREYGCLIEDMKKTSQSENRLRTLIIHQRMYQSTCKSAHAKMFLASSLETKNMTVVS